MEEERFWVTEARVLRAWLDLARRAVVFHLDSRHGARVIFQALKKAAQRILFVTPDCVLLLGCSGDQCLVRLSIALRPPPALVPVPRGVGGWASTPSPSTPAELRWYEEAPGFQHDLLMHISSIARFITYAAGREIGCVPVEVIELRYSLDPYPELELPSFLGDPRLN